MNLKLRIHYLVANAKTFNSTANYTGFESPVYKVCEDQKKKKPEFRLENESWFHHNQQRDISLAACA